MTSEPITPAPAAEAAPPRTRLTVAAVLVAACFVLSGFVGLAYEIAWIRKASLVFGAASFALATVLAVFFLGLALGSWLFGRYSRRVSRPLVAYGLLELGLGGLVALSPPAFALADVLYGWGYPHVGHSFAALSAARFVLVTFLLLPPTILMGGTLPMMCRQYVTRRDRIARRVGVLYGLNTLGAAAGCAVAGFYAVPAIGVNAILYAGAGVNLLIGLIALTVGRAAAREPAPAWAAAPPLEEPGRLSGSARRSAATLVYVLFFLVGFVVLANEVLWSRYLSLHIRNTVHTYTVTLTVVLVGIVLGSLLAAVLFDRFTRRAVHFGSIQAASGLITLTVLMLPAAWWQPAEAAGPAGARLWALAALLLLPAVPSGLCFPLAVRMVAHEPALAGVDVGRMTAVNTLGGILGSLAAGFLGIPVLGLHTSVLASAAISLGIAAVAWLFIAREGAWVGRALILGAALAAWWAIPYRLGTHLPQDFLAQHGQLRDFREGVGANLALIQRDEHLELEIDRLWQGTTRKSHQIMAAHVPMLLHPAPQRVVVVGVGMGQTCSRLTMYDLAHLDCVDIERELFDLLRAHTPSAWLDDPRVRLIVEDGRNYLSYAPVQYDLISIEIGQTFRPGVASFYTAEFYRQARRRLAPGGLLSQFVPISFLTLDEFRAVVATFIAEFPNSWLWYNTSELLLIGGGAAVPRPGPGCLARLDRLPQVRADLEYAYWGGPQHWLNRPEVFFAGFLCGPDGLRRIAAGAPRYHDDRPRLEYSTAAHQEAVQASEVLALLRANLEPLETLFGAPPDPALAEASARLREQNLDDIPVSAALLDAEKMLRAQGEPRRVLELLAQCRKRNPDNVALAYLIGEACRALGNLSEAIWAYEDALRIDPAYVVAHNRLGALLLQRQDLDGAQRHAAEAVRLRPTFAEAHNNLGAALAHRGQLDQAEHHFAEAVRLDPDYAVAHCNLGILLARRGQTEEAAAQFRAALRIKPDYQTAARALETLATSQRGSGR